MMIRLLKKQDIDEFVAMSTVFYTMPACAHSVPATHFYNTAEYCLTHPTDYVVLVIEVENTLAGYCSLALSYSTEAGGKHVQIDEIYIKDEHQGQGLGKKLFDHIYAHYPAKRYRLESTQSNQRAIKLYKTLGFKELGYVQLILDKE